MNDMKKINADDASNSIIQRIEILNPLVSDRIGLVRRLLGLVVNPERLWPAIMRRINRKAKTLDWNKRVQELGRLAVIDSRHSADEYEYVTQKQKNILYPYFKGALHGQENTLLDFGCGPGRFTEDLAKIINGSAVGFDISPELVAMAKQSELVKYSSANKFLEINQTKFDVIWSCLVLGGIPEPELLLVAKELTDSLSPNGLMFVVESTGSVDIEDYWRIRKVSFYTSIFPGVKMEKIGSYYDCDQEISILSGRKNRL